MRRRRLLQLLGAATVAGPAVAGGSSTATATAAGSVDALEFYSTSSLVGPDDEPLTGSSVAVRAGASARNGDEDWGNDAVVYDGDIPLMAADGNVVGFGSTMVADGSVASGYDNTTLVLNVLDALAGGDRVLWDEAHDQYWSLDRFGSFESAAEGRGYTVEATGDLARDLPDADALVVMPPRWSYWEDALSAVEEFVAGGGALLLFNQSDYNDYDRTGNLNDICDRLGVSFRFNDDQVTDSRNNAGRKWQPTTTRFDESLPFFGGGGGGDNEAPSVEVTLSPSSVTVGESLTASADASDPDGSIASYEWSFGDGDSATGEGVSHAYDAAGEYTVSVTVTDDRGATASASKTVTVTEPEGDRIVTDVREVLDGDTVKVKVDGKEESIRVLGVDTAEKPSNRRYEREEEWEGIESLSYLGTWGTNASEFGKSKLSGETIAIEFDPAEGKRDPFDRLLAYVYYDENGDGSRDRLYNRQLIEEGQARVYGSNLTKHDDFRAAEEAARSAGRGVWGEADPGASSEIRNDAVEDLYVPHPAPVTADSGSLADGRVPVYAESSASVDGGSTSGEVPLVGVDEDANVGLVSGLVVDETYEKEEDFAVDTSGYGNFPFLTNLIDYLGDGSGDVAIEAGHGQFGADFALSNEDAAYYQRFLEGVDVAFDQYNDVAAADLSGYRALLVTAPVSDYSAAERKAVEEFASSGGTVLLLGDARADSAARRRLNDLAAALGSDLRFGSGAVRDSSNNLNGNRKLPTTSNFDESFPLFGAYGSSGGGGGGGGDEPTGSGTYTGSLSGTGDGRTHTHPVGDGASGATVSLSGPSDADFDLYVELDGTPTTDDYDERSWNYGSEEEVTLEDYELGGVSELGILVDSYEGSGEYELTVTTS